jgi:alcohol dehydrogenase class IV
VEDGDDLSARTDMLAAAALAGRCLQNATMGAHHGLTQLLGGRTGIPHGLANALLLSHVIRFNAAAVPDEMARIGAALGAPDDPAGAVRALVARLGLPGGLGDCGVSEDDLDAVARLSQSNANVANNPCPVSEADARAILQAAF